MQVAITIGVIAPHKLALCDTDDNTADDSSNTSDDNSSTSDDSPAAAQSQ